jgi:tellurite resistance protein TerC
MDRFVYLEIGLAVVLVFVGAKFIYTGLFDAKVPIWISLPFILLVVLVAILASLYKTRGRQRKEAPGSEEPEKRVH